MGNCSGNDGDAPELTERNRQIEDQLRKEKKIFQQEIKLLLVVNCYAKRYRLQERVSRLS